MKTLSEYHLSMATKYHKNAIKRFYQDIPYAYSYMGLDQTFIIKEPITNQIIASVMVSKLSPDNPQYFLHALGVGFEYRQQGLASLLLKTVNTHFSQLKAASAHPVDLIAFAEQNLTSFYLKQGYISVQEDALLPCLGSRYLSYKKTKKSLSIFKYQA